MTELCQKTMTKIETDKPQEEAIRQTYAPIAMAMGITMIFWGILAHPYGIGIWAMSAGGAGMLAWALYSWMREICHEWSVQDES